MYRNFGDGRVHKSLVDKSFKKHIYTNKKRLLISRIWIQMTRGLTHEYKFCKNVRKRRKHFNRYLPEGLTFSSNGSKTRFRKYRALPSITVKTK